MNSLITDTERITAKIEGYVLGCQKGDEATLKDVFHPEARMFGAVGDTRYDLTIVPGMSQAVTDMPTVDHDARILSIDGSNGHDAAISALDHAAHDCARAEERARRVHLEVGAPVVERRAGQ